MALDWLKQLAKSRSLAPANGVGHDSKPRLLRLGDSSHRKPRRVAADDIKRRILHPRAEHKEHALHWRWLLDSFEGGERYRNAFYGTDRRGLPARNLVRHRREYPDPQMYPGAGLSLTAFVAGSSLDTGGASAMMGGGPWPGQTGADPYATALDDDYELRRARTPVPEFVAEAVEIHLGKIYDQQVSRSGPADLTDWWSDCNGRGTPMDDWIRKTVAPLLMVLGCLDVVLDHPEIPPGETVETLADENRLGLGKCVASVILPENMIWWRTDPAGRYTECLVREFADPADRVDYDKKGRAIDPHDESDAAKAWRTHYLKHRHWTATGWTLYNHDATEVDDQGSHPFGQVPIVRLVDIPRHRTPHIGKSRYEAIAYIQREFYNRDSELILNDTIQAHPILSGAKEFMKAENTITVGPNNVLPYGADSSGNVLPWMYVSPPKDPAESLRQNKKDLVDAKDRRASLTKPAGTPGTTGGTVAQSGISKNLDAVSGNKVLSDIAKTMAMVERQLAEYALLVLRHRVPTPEERAEIGITYPVRFQLYAAEELILNMQGLQLCLAGLITTRVVPTMQGEMIAAILASQMSGLQPEVYELIKAEIAQAVAVAKVAGPGIMSKEEELVGTGSRSQGAGSDSTGQSGATSVSGSVTSR